MKKILTIMLMAAFAVTTQGQQPNPRLAPLEEYIQQHGIAVKYKLSNYAGNITHSKQTDNLTTMYGNAAPTGKSGLERRQDLIDSIRTVFTGLSKNALESYMYEYHKQGKDTVKYSYEGEPFEFVTFDYKKKPKSNTSGTEHYVTDVFCYRHYYSVPSGAKKEDMKAFDGEEFNVYLQPVLQKFLKLKGAKAYSVHWQHDDGFKNDDDFCRTAEYRRTKDEAGKNAGLTSGTHYIIPSEHEATAKILYKQLDSLAYDYLTKHPEQPYSYEFTSGFPESSGSHVIEGLGGFLEGKDKKDNAVYYLRCKREQDGNYHILTLNSKGAYWIPKDWASLKSYINGEKVYIKGMEPKKEKDKK